MDIFIFMLVILAALLYGIRLGNDTWVNHAYSNKPIRCRGKLYKVEEQELYTAQEQEQ